MFSKLELSVRMEKELDVDINENVEMGSRIEIKCLDFAKSSRLKSSLLKISSLKGIDLLKGVVNYS